MVGLEPSIFCITVRDANHYTKKTFKKHTKKSKCVYAFLNYENGGMACHKPLPCGLSRKISHVE